MSQQQSADWVRLAQSPSRTERIEAFFGGHGYVREWGVEQIVRDARVAMIYEGTNEIQAIDLLVRKVLPDGGQAMGQWLLTLRNSLDAGRALDAEVLRCLAQLRYFTTVLAQACKEDDTLAWRVADDYLRCVAVVLLGWAWNTATAPGPVCQVQEVHQGKTVFVPRPCAEVLPK